MQQMLRVAIYARVSSDQQSGDNTIASQATALQARVSAELQRSASSNGYNPAVAGPVRQGSGSMVWPGNGPITSATDSITI